MRITPDGVEKLAQDGYETFLDSNLRYEILRIAYEIDRGTSGAYIDQSDIAEELDVRPELLYLWRQGFAAKAEKSFPGNGNRSDADTEIERLRKELTDLRMERDILKKAVSIFSESDGKGSAS